MWNKPTTDHITDNWDFGGKFVEIEVRVMRYCDNQYIVITLDNCV